MTDTWNPERYEKKLIPRWVSALAPGGWFAMQAPGNSTAPSHTLLREVAGQWPVPSSSSHDCAGVRRSASPRHTPR